MRRPVTTLFMLMSLDGKISTGEGRMMDFDADLPRIDGVKEGLHQYYEIEKTTDLWSMVSGKTQDKLGVNSCKLSEKTDVSFVVIDNNNLIEQGIKYFAGMSKTFVLVTTNKNHPAFGMVGEENINIIFQEELNLHDVFEKLCENYACNRITIQTGGTLNEMFLRAGLFDYVDIVIAPVIVGGKDTPTLVDGLCLPSSDWLSKLGVLKLEMCAALRDSYVRLRYKVVK